MNRDFFNSNTIKRLDIQTPKNSQSSLKRNFQTTQRLKRVTSCRDTSLKLNPEKFINREVFNSKLYSAKPLDIAVQFNKQSLQKCNKFYSFQDNDSVILLKSKLQSQSIQQLISAINSISHYFKTIHQDIDSQLQRSGQAIKKQLSFLKESFEKVLKIFCKEIQHHEKNYSKLKIQKIAYQNTQNLSKIATLENSGYTTQRRPSFSSKLFMDSTQQNFWNPRETNSLKPSTSGSLRSSRVLQQDSSLNKIKSLKNMLNTIQFENKKHILRIESLQNEKSQSEQKIKELEKKVADMREKMQKVNEIEEFYNYKIKKLKEELEVAHIVKEQNLAEKMRYILQS